MIIQQKTQLVDRIIEESIIFLFFLPSPFPLKLLFTRWQSLQKNYNNSFIPSSYTTFPVDSELSFCDSFKDLKSRAITHMMTHIGNETYCYSKSKTRLFNILNM